MVLESPFWLKYVPKSETFWSWVWNDISRFSSSYDSSVVLVLYSLYFDENLGDFRSNMFARIDNIMWWDGPFSTVLYLFFATGVAHSHKTDDEWPRKLSRPHPKDTQGRIPLNDKPYWEVSFFSLFFFFFSSFFPFSFFFFRYPHKVKIFRSRQELSSCGENSTNESKVTFFGTVMYSSFEGSDRCGGLGSFFGGLGSFFTRCFPISKESLIH